MFAYTVTNQALDTFNEVGLPYLLRSVNHFRAKESTESVAQEKGAGPQSKAYQNEQTFLESVRQEVALPEYELFADYDEMVTQFGYVVLWSAIWPIAPGSC